MTPGLFERWRRRLRGDSVATPVTTAAPTVPAEPAAPDVLDLDLATTLQREFPREYPVAEASASAVIALVAGADLAPLARHSPSLAGYDWVNYLRCSLCRVVRVQRALAVHAPPGGLVLDYGSYFGNFGLAARAMGFRVEAIDSYASYGGALAPWVSLQREAGVMVHDFADAGHDLAALGEGRYDAVICAGVLEHIPHTPRLLLAAVTASLKPGGVLILDTPNLAYLYKRLALLEGQSIFAPIAQQYFTEIPFEGHHREYTVAEVEWLLNAAGHVGLSIDTFNYSLFGQTRLTGEHLAYYRAMAADPALRELIVSVSRRRPEPARAQDRDR